MGCAHEIQVIQSNPMLLALAEIEKDVVFSTATGVELKMDILHPWYQENDDGRRYPLIVFVQGSAWRFPGVGYEIPQLAGYARAGYVVATVTHRNCLEGHPFPAFLQDVKTAIRYLKSNAEKYRIDPKRVALWGTSSGANASLLCAMTQGEEKYETGEWADVNDDVNCVVACFGPTNLERMAEADKPLEEFEEIMNALAGDRDVTEVMREMSPVNHVEMAKPCPPVLLLHGDADELVPYDQALELYNKMNSNAMFAKLICVKDAPHEGAFWSNEVHMAIMKFIMGII